MVTEKKEVHQGHTIDSEVFRGEPSQISIWLLTISNRSLEGIINPQVPVRYI